MNSRKLQGHAIEKIHLLSLFKQDLASLYEGTHSLNDAQRLRTRIRQNASSVRDIVAGTRCL